MICGSPKMSESTSGYLLQQLSTMIKGQHEIITYNIGRKSLQEQDYQSIAQSKAIVIAFPLYIDSIPSQLLRFFVEMEKRLRSLKSQILVYCITINGFYEGKQNCNAIDNVKLWCESCGLIFAGGIGHGVGEMIPLVKYIPMGHGPNKNLGNALNKMANDIANEQSSGEVVLLNVNWPRIMWKIQSSQLVWHPRAKKNGLSKRDLHKRL